MFGYVEDVSTWQPWQREYRYGAFYVFPPVGTIEAVDELRATHDPTSHAICQARISLSEPLARPMTEDDVEQVRAALRGIRPFQISYGRPYATTPHPGVVYRIEPRDVFGQLRTTLHALPLFSGVELRREGIPAHMTIAEFLTVNASEQLAAQLNGTVAQGTWECCEVEYAIPNLDFTFQRVATFPLAA